MKNTRLLMAMIAILLAAGAKAQWKTSYYCYTTPYGPQLSFENEIIRIDQKGDSIRGWFYGTSDECDYAREGYFPGFFVKELQKPCINNGKISFTIIYKGTTFLNKPFPLNYSTNEEALKSGDFKIWVQQGLWDMRHDSVAYKGTFSKEEIVLFPTENFGESIRFVKTTLKDILDMIKKADYSFVIDNTIGSDPRKYYIEEDNYE